MTDDNACRALIEAHEIAHRKEVAKLEERIQRLSSENTALRGTLAGLYGLRGEVVQKQILYSDALRIIAENYRKVSTPNG